jgi:V/A-type H+-transporting ATPase subunit I
MKKVSMVVHYNYLDDVIKLLHEKGIMEIIDIEKDDIAIHNETEKASMQPDSGLCANYELRLTRLIDILNSIRLKASGLKAILNTKTPEIKKVEDCSLDEIYSLIEGTLINIEKKIIDYDKKMLELDEKIEKLSSNIESLNYLKYFDFNLKDIGKTDYIILKVGKTTDIDPLKNEINLIDKATIYSKKIGKGKEIEWSVVILSHISEENKIEKLSREYITELDLIGFSDSPIINLKTTKKEKKDLLKEKKQILERLRVLAEEQLPELLAIREQIRFERIRKEVSKNFVKTDSTIIIKGWILEKDQDELQELITNTTDYHIVYDVKTPSQNPDNPPTHLEIPRWAGSFRTLLELFATPKYNEINPTMIMGIFFILFFGIMLGDVGYGLIIFLLSLFAYIKFAKYKTMIKNWSFLGVWLGLTTSIVGILTNSFFGDFIPRFIFNDTSKTLYSASIGGIQFPVEPIRDPLSILLVALIFGLIHLNTGIFLAIYQCYKNKQIKSMITKHISWIFLQIGGGALIGDLLLHIWTLGSMEFYILIIMVLCGLILLLIDAGPLGLFDVTGFIGDWLSYARLLALGLGTTGMALAFNIVAEIIPDMVPVIGVILVPIILIVTHIANLGIQALGAGVHSLRLQYVEFFNRFYQGGGRKFKPFSMNRQYTKIEEIE